MQQQNPNVPQAHPLKFRTLVRGRGGPKEAVNDVIDDAEELDDYARDCTGEDDRKRLGEAKPRFEREKVIAVALGLRPTPAYEVEIVSVVQITGGFVGLQTQIHYVTRSPAGPATDPAALAAPAYPHHVVRVKNAGGLIIFRDVTPVATTKMLGEEEPPATTLAVGEEGGGFTTLAVGEEEPRYTTLAVGEEDPRPTTLAVGEEDPRPTTLAVGEEDPRPTTLAIGEEDPRPTTLAVGEEGGPTTLAIGEEDPRPTTLAVGEEGGPTTLAIGEEGGGATTLAVGEETRYTTLAVGEEGPTMTTMMVGEESARRAEDPTTLATGEEGGTDPTTLATGEESRGGAGPFGGF